MEPPRISLPIRGGGSGGSRAGCDYSAGAMAGAGAGLGDTVQVQQRLELGRVECGIVCQTYLSMSRPADVGGFSNQSVFSKRYAKTAGVQEIPQ